MSAWLDPLRSAGHYLIGSHLVRHGGGPDCCCRRDVLREGKSRPQSYSWPTALHFHQPDGTRWPANSGAPVVLIALGDDDAERLRISGIPGAFVPRKSTWRPAKAKGRQADLFDGGYNAAADFRRFAG